MKRILIIFSLTLILIRGYSQDEKFVIKFCPLSLIDDVTFPTIQGGFEFKLSHGFTWYNEVGIKYRKGYYEVSDTSFLKSYGFKLKTEIRYYLPKIFGIENTNYSLSGFYVGGNIFYNRDFHNSEIGYYNNKDSSILTIDNFAVKKSVLGTNFVFGLQKPIWNNILLDLYAGLGFRLRIISNIKREYDPNSDSKMEPIDLTIQGIRDNIDVLEGISGTANLTFGYRLCYKF